MGKECECCWAHSCDCTRPTCAQCGAQYGLPLDEGDEESLCPTCRIYCIACLDIKKPEELNDEDLCASCAGGEDATSM